MIFEILFLLLNFTSSSLLLFDFWPKLHHLSAFNWFQLLICLKSKLLVQKTPFIFNFRLFLKPHLLLELLKVFNFVMSLLLLKEFRVIIVWFVPKLGHDCWVMLLRKLCESDWLLTMTNWCSFVILFHELQQLLSSFFITLILVIHDIFIKSRVLCLKILKSLL